MTPEENILKKIRALATMADPTRGGSKAEVEMAAKHMQKLMDQYNVSLLEVLQDPAQTTVEFVKVTCSSLLGAVKPWHWATDSFSSLCRCLIRRGFSRSTASSLQPTWLRWSLRT